MNSPGLAGSDNQGLGDMTSSIFDREVNAADADLVFRSSDGVLFRIHRKNLEFGSDGFPPVEFPVDDKPVDLPEDGKTLELMFRFVYPRLQPTLEGLDFRVLAHLAEAVEKYQIFTGKQLCNLYMSEALPTNAMAILEYSIKHEYPALANRAAPHVTLKDLSQKKMITDVSDNVLRAWVPYYNRWTEAIRGIMTCSYATRSFHYGGITCTLWQQHRDGIIQSLAAVVGKQNDASIVSRISPPLGAPSCCFTEAGDWQREAKRLISSIDPFIPEA